MVPLIVHFILSISFESELSEIPSSSDETYTKEQHLKLLAAAVAASHKKWTLESKSLDRLLLSYILESSWRSQLLYGTTYELVGHSMLLHRTRR